MIDNPYGKHSFDDLDESWYRYMAADRKERKRMCNEALEIEGMVLFVFVVIGIGFSIWLLIKGII